MYGKGKGVKSDGVEAVKWLGKGANQGNALAQYALGVCYKLGYGVKSSRKLERYWYSKAAKQGMVAAQKALQEKV
jgi:hypothetical protein